VLGWASQAAIASLAILAALHRLSWWPWHQHPWSLDALGYFEPQARALLAFRLDRFLFSWQGLHPPLAGWVHGALEAAGASLAVHWAAATLASVGALLLGALWLRPRHGLGAALLFAALLAASPVQGWYGSWIGPYPYWTLLLVASTTALLRAEERGTRRDFLLAGVLAALACWTHVLSLAAVVVQATFLLGRALGGRRHLLAPGRAWLVPVLPAVAVVVAMALLRAQDPWTYHVEPGDRGFWVDHPRILSARFGPTAAHILVLVTLLGGTVLGLLGPARRVVGLAFAQAAAIVLALVFFLALGVADARLTHYETGPEVLVTLAAAAGLGSVRSAAIRRGLQVAAAGLGAAAVALLLQWELPRWKAARAARASPEARSVRILFEGLAPGDTVLWLWAPAFLEDEPEQLDLGSQGWPTASLGAPCFLPDPPPFFCHELRGARVLVSPNLILDDPEGWRDALERVIAGRNDRLTVVVPRAPTPRPWPLEPLLQDAGLRPRSVGEMLVWEGDSTPGR
jgi:hypothetical protein